MKFNLRTVSFVSLAAIALLSAPVGIVSEAQAEGGRRSQRLEQLDLSADQFEQIQAIRTDARSQIDSILTDEQRATLAGREDRRAWRELDLSDSQREQIRSVYEASRAEASAILTTEQQAQLEAMRENRQHRRNSRRR